MLNHLMPVETFELLKQRAENSIYIEGVVDKKIASSVERINEHPDMATIFSCQGHPERTGTAWCTGGYVMIATRNIEAVYDLYQTFCERTEDQTQIKLSFTRRINILKYPTEETYPVVVLGWDMTVETETNILNAFNAAVVLWSIRQKKLNQ